MQIIKPPTCHRIILILTCAGLGSLARLEAGDANTAPPAIPAIIQAGFAEWARGGAAASLELWKKGGLMETDRKVLAEANYFKRLDGVLGGFKGFDTVQSQAISASSEVVYLAINFQRAVVYARFLLYRTEQDWVVQNMDFNAKPEALIPWLALPASVAAE
jgi:hypothetical protein